MEKYKVVSHIYDSGEADFKLCGAADSEVSKCVEHAHYDYYVDVFDNYAEAKEFYDDCRAEHGISGVYENEIESDEDEFEPD